MPALWIILLFFCVFMATLQIWDVSVILWHRMSDWLEQFMTQGAVMKAMYWSWSENHTMFHKTPSGLVWELEDIQQSLSAGRDNHLTQSAVSSLQ